MSIFIKQNPLALVDDYGKHHKGKNLNSQRTVGEKKAKYMSPHIWNTKDWTN